MLAVQGMKFRVPLDVKGATRLPAPVPVIATAR
jgi:hypothetical protein